MPVLVLAGEEDFELYRHLDKLKAELVDSQWASFNYSRLINPSQQEVYEQALTVPFGMGNKVLIFDRCDWFTKKRASAKEESAAAKKSKAKEEKKGISEEALEDALKGVHPSTYLIFVCVNNFDSSLRISKLVARVAELKEFPKAKFYSGTAHPQLEKWCQDEAKRFGATIEIEAVSYLLDGLEGNLRQISSEIEKAATFVMPQNFINADVVKRLSPHHSQVFVVCDSWLSQKNEQDSLKLMVALKEMLARQNAMQVMAAVQTILAKWVHIKCLCDFENGHSNFGPGMQRRELPPQELVKRISHEIKAHPFALEKDIRKLQSVSTQSLIEKRKQLTRLEFLVKSGQMSDHHALETFFLDKALASPRH
jgi:DNA polymerase III delta subunit